MLKFATIALASALSLSSLAGSASALTVPAAAPQDASRVHPADYICGPGEHIGYEGKHCWPNHPLPPIWREWPRNSAMAVPFNAHW